MRIDGGIAGNVIPDAASVTVNFRFAPDRSVEQAREHVHDVFDGLDVTMELTDAAAGALPGLTKPAAAALVARRRGTGSGQVRLDRRGPIRRAGHPRGQLRSRRPQPCASRRRARAVVADHGHHRDAAEIFAWLTPLPWSGSRHQTEVGRRHGGRRHLRVTGARRRSSPHAALRRLHERPSMSSIVSSRVSFGWPDGTSLFSDLSFTVPAGRTGLVAPNGAGKSTLLKLITGELLPAGGVGHGRRRARPSATDAALRRRAHRRRRPGRGTGHRGTGRPRRRRRQRVRVRRDR